MTLTLIQYPRALGLMNPSPFCVKVELFLKLAGLTYQVDDRTPPFKAPKRKLPALRDGDAVVADSEAILAHLQARHGRQLPAALRAMETGMQRALRRLLEEDLYFTLLWWRWEDEAGYALSRTALFGTLPALLRGPVAGLVRRKIRRDLMGQGMGRHSRDEVARRACADLDAVAEWLGGQTFFAGAAPGAIDCSAYAFLGGILFAPQDTPMQRHLRELPSLVAYCLRMEALAGR